MFRSGCCWNRGRGRIFYFRPGHESYPHFHNEQILRVISNAVRWAAPDNPGFDDVANEKRAAGAHPREGVARSAYQRYCAAAKSMERPL